MEEPYFNYIFDVTTCYQLIQELISQNLDQRYDGRDVITKWVLNYPNPSDILQSEAWDYESDQTRWLKGLEYCEIFIQPQFHLVGIFESVSSIHFFPETHRTMMSVYARKIPI
jgi:hypothetical protein|nr:MAG TPA: hypothetical protein [Caudoviricetes sp.]